VQPPVSPAAGPVAKGAGACVRTGSEPPSFGLQRDSGTPVGCTRAPPPTAGIISRSEWVAYCPGWCPATEPPTTRAARTPRCAGQRLQSRSPLTTNTFSLSTPSADCKRDSRSGGKCRRWSPPAWCHPANGYPIPGGVIRVERGFGDTSVGGIGHVGDLGHHRHGRGHPALGGHVLLSRSWPGDSRPRGHPAQFQLDPADRVRPPYRLVGRAAVLSGSCCPDR
jgi:hypothetical protein